MPNELSNSPLEIANADLVNQLIHIYKEEFSIDLNEFQLYLLRRRISIACSSLKTSLDEFVKKKNSDFQERADQILSFLCPDHTELFRDFEVWKMLRDNLLSKILLKTKAKILIPYSTSGEDLYSLLILLQEFFHHSDVEIMVLGPSEWALQRMSKGILIKPKSRSSFTNFKSICPESDLNSYLEKHQNNYCFKMNVVKNVEFRKSIRLEEIKNENFDLIICRNKSLPYKSSAVTNFFHSILNLSTPGGIVVCGLGESIQKNVLTGFHIISWSEKVFQRKTQ